jgi:hypothetical protein
VANTIALIPSAIAIIVHAITKIFDATIIYASVFLEILGAIHLMLNAIA